MALKNVTFNRGQGGLGRPLAGEDHYSGAIFYTDTLPSGFGASDREKVITSIGAAEALGITDDYSDETAATGTYQVTTAGAAGDVFTLQVTEYKQLLETGEYDTRVWTLCSFTAATADVASVNTMAAKINEQINLNTSTHGYTSTVATDTVTITARDGMGIFLNSGTPITASITGTIAGTITQFSSGVASELAIFHYHISEFFRKQPKGILYTGIYADTSKVIGADLVTLQTFAEGKIRQCMIYQSTTAWAASQTTTIQSYVDTLIAANQPMSVVYAAMIDAVSDLTALTDLKTLTNEKVSVCIAQDFQGKGWELWNAHGVSITHVGATLGTVALAGVEEDIANPENFDFSNGVELERIGFANGDYYSETSSNTLDLLEDRGYLFLRKFPGVISGSYSSSSRTATTIASDYAYIESNRVIDKAVRNLNSAYTPKLSSKVLLTSAGKLRDADIVYYQTVGTTALDQMLRDEEVSAFSVSIDPDQPILSTSTLAVSVTIVPVGIAKEIEINIGYALSI